MTSRRKALVLALAALAVIASAPSWFHAYGLNEYQFLPRHLIAWSHMLSAISGLAVAWMLRLRTYPLEWDIPYTLHSTGWFTVALVFGANAIMALIVALLINSY